MHGGSLEVEPQCGTRRGATGHC